MPLQEIVTPAARHPGMRAGVVPAHRARSLPMKTMAIVLEQPEHIAFEPRSHAAGDDDVVVDIEYSGISTGTEKLLWSGRMPAFPGMGYPLVPGYESVGASSPPGRRPATAVGERVFVPGANCFGEVRGLFGGAASRWWCPARRASCHRRALGEQACCWPWPPRPITRWPVPASASRSCRPTSSSATACSAACWRA
jgi:hypothetical protein